MKIIDEELLNISINKSRASLRKRTNFNFHDTPNDPIQRMLNIIQPYSYIRPHRHINPDKTEVFIILSGRAVVVEFDDNGNILDYFILDIAKKHYGVELSKRSWHTIIALEEDTVVYEIKEGPYIPLEDKDFAEWSPKEGDTITNSYIDELLLRLGLKI